MSKLLTVSQAQDIANGVIAKVKNKGYALSADLGALAGKSSVEKTDLAQALSDEITAATTGVSSNASAINTLNGTGTGSIKKAIDDAFDDFATKVSDDNVVNTYKELIDYAAANGSEMATLTGKVSANESAIGSKAVSESSEGAGDGKAATGLYKEIEDAISTAQTANTTALSGKVDKETGKGLSTNDFTAAYKDKLDDIEIAQAADITAVISALDNL